MNLRGYWYNTATGDIKDVSTSKHIQAVIDKPEDFNLDKKIIEDTYALHDESLGYEGDAREILIKRIVGSSDWARIREYQTRQRYWITVNYQKDEQKEKVLKAFPFFDSNFINWQKESLWLAETAGQGTS